MPADWMVTVRLRLPMLVEHDEPDAEKLAREVLDEESLVGVAEFETMEVLELVRVPDPPGQSAGVSP